MEPVTFVKVIVSFIFGFFGFGICAKFILRYCGATDAYAVAFLLAIFCLVLGTFFGAIGVFFVNFPGAA